MSMRFELTGGSVAVNTVVVYQVYPDGSQPHHTDERGMLGEIGAHGGTDSNEGMPVCAGRRKHTD